MFVLFDELIPYQQLFENETLTMLPIRCYTLLLCSHSCKLYRIRQHLYDIGVVLLL